MWRRLMSAGVFSKTRDAWCSRWGHLTFLHLKHSFWQCRDIETLPLCLTGLWWENTGDNQWGFQLWADLFTRFKSSQADLLFTRFIWCHIYLNAVSRILLQWASRREWAGRLQSVNQHFIQLSALLYQSISIVRVVWQLYVNQSCSWIVACCDDLFAWLLQVHIIWTWSIYYNLKAKAEESLKELVYMYCLHHMDIIRVCIDW